MQSANNVLTAAFDGHVREVSIDLGISDKRLYQAIGTNDPYNRTWRLLNPLGRVAPDRIEIVRADFNARCDRLTRGKSEPATAASTHKETSDVVQLLIARTGTKAELKNAALEAIAELQDIVRQCDETDTIIVGRFAS